MKNDDDIPCTDETHVIPPGWTLTIHVNSSSTAIPPITKQVSYWGDPMRVANQIVNNGYTHMHSEGVYSVYPAHRIDEVFVRRQNEN